MNFIEIIEGTLDAFKHRGTNIILEIEKGIHFSYNAGLNEVAFKINNHYYILMGNEILFELVKTEYDKGLTTEEIIKFWINMKENWPVSEWSNDFAELGENKE